MKRVLVIVSLITFICLGACGQQKSNRKEVQYVVNDEKTSNWTNSLLTTIDNNELEVSKEPKQNLHNPKRTDTIVSAKSKNSTLIIYKAQDKLLLQSAIIKGQELQLDNKVRIGMSKSDLAEVVSSQPLDNLVRIGYVEGLQYFEFQFVDGILMTIKYCGSPD